MVDDHHRGSPPGFRHRRLRLDGSPFCPTADWRDHPGSRRYVRPVRGFPARAASTVLSPCRYCPLLPNRVPNSPLRFAARSWGLASGDVTEAGRTVTASGSVSLGDHIISAGLPLTGQRVTLRPGGPVARILAGGVLVRTVACPVPPGAHAARPSRLPSDPTPSRSPSSLAAPSPRPGPLAATSDGTRHRNTADDRRRAEPSIGR